VEHQVVLMVIQVVAVVQVVLELLVVFQFVIAPPMQLQSVVAEQVYLHLDVKLGMVIKELIQKLQ
tara:strand:- start:383 stop:577 length:195 start_codon:yes stop_codon:yes gene_type:complete